MNKPALRSVLLLAFVCFLVDFSRAESLGAGPIDAGKRLGDVDLRESDTKVTALLGKPAGQDMAMGREICVWHLFQADNPTRFDVLFFRDESSNKLRVTEIRVNSNAFTTPHGITVGSTLEQVMKRYPDVKKRHLDAQNLDVYDSVAKGIAFETDGSGKVTAVIVHRPGRESTISSVTLP